MRHYGKQLRWSYIWGLDGLKSQTNKQLEMYNKPCRCIQNHGVEISPLCPLRQGQQDRALGELTESTLEGWSRESSHRDSELKLIPGENREEGTVSYRDGAADTKRLHKHSRTVDNRMQEPACDQVTFL